MEVETEIESFVRQFVSSQIGEEVYVDFSERTKVTVRPVNKTGSTTLAMLWAKVLQHPGNFPARSHLYKNQYGVVGDNQLVLRLDDITLTVLMRTGTLVIQGPYPLEWFIRYFRDIVEVYKIPGNHKRSILAKEQNGLLGKSELASKTPTANESTPTAQTAEQSHAVHDKVQFWEEPAVKPTTNYKRQTEIGGALSNKSPMPSSLACELLALKSGRVEHGPTYIYRLWKLLLSHWFSTPGTKVYIATPYIDIQRLIDISLLVVTNRKHAHLEAVITNQKHQQMASIFELQTRCLRTFPANEQVLLEYNVFNSFFYPETACNAKFIAGIHGDETEILITSASFHADHFIDDGTDIVIFKSMKTEEFLKKYIQPMTRNR
ncbi:hypothetical protein ScPMuIL_014601 [Solemya velum]